MGRGRSEKQKQKLLYMAQLLYERTDEDHPVTTQEVIDYLEANGIRSERKTVYTDMEELEHYTGQGTPRRILSCQPEI